MAIPSYGGFPLWNDQPVDPYANGWQPFNGRNAGVQAGFSALTNLGAGLLSGRNWSEGLSRGLMGANQGFQDSMQNARRDYYVDQQGRYMQRKMQQEDRQNEREDAAAARKQAAIEDVIAHPPAGVDPTQWATQVRANSEGYLNAYAKSAFEPPKPPEVHTFNQGSMAVDKQWNAKTGQWETLSSAPRWQPQQAPEQWVDIKDEKGNVIGQRSNRSGKFEPIAANGMKPSEIANIEGKLRDDYTGATKDFPVMAAGLRKLTAAAKSPSAASDVALIFSYMKILDPTSVVREGEFATAQNAAGVPDQIQNVYNRILKGERLNDQQRVEFVTSGQQMYSAALVGYQRAQQQYTDIAKRSGVNPQNVITDASSPDDTAPFKPPQQQQGAALNTPSMGAPGVPMNVAPPPDAVAFLRANPGLAAQFDAKYGPGSAARVLGGPR